jgi:hypothetical protein
MKIFLLMLIAFAGFADSTAAQVKKFRWTTELCEYEGTYDARKYSDAELRNTLKLFALGGEFRINTEATVWKFEDIGRLDVAALDREYNRVTSELKNLKIVRASYFENLRQRKLKEVEQVYRLSRTTMQAYANPALIGEYKFASACVAKFAAPLANGGADLLGVWRAVNEDSRKKNGDPARLERIFNEQMNSADREKHARVEVMSFGWWNCANESIEYVEYDGTPEKQFDKLFARVKTISCDEP